MPEYKNVKICVTFVPSFRLVRQTISDTSSCHIIDQKSAIVLGLGPDNNTIIREKNNVLQILFNRITIQSKKKDYPEWQCISVFFVFPKNKRNI